MKQVNFALFLLIPSTKPQVTIKQYQVLDSHMVASFQTKNLGSVSFKFNFHVLTKVVW